MKLMARKHVYAPPHRNVVPTESHNDGQNAGYFLRTLWTMLLALGSNKPLLHRNPEAASWELIPLACTCGDFWEACSRLYLPHLTSGRGSYTEVDIWGRHERGSPRSLGCSVTWSTFTICYRHNLAEPEGGPRTRGAQKMNMINLWIGSCMGAWRAESAMYLV
jgi:hypothetical protein